MVIGGAGIILLAASGLNWQWGLPSAVAGVLTSGIVLVRARGLLRVSVQVKAQEKHEKARHYS